jgi:hypothetical protein
MPSFSLCTQFMKARLGLPCPKGALFERRQVEAGEVELKGGVETTQVADSAQRQKR